MFDVRTYPLISDQIEYPELAVIIRELRQVLANNTPGDVVELGCYEGTTSLFLQRVLCDQASHRRYHVYDSFDGLPAKTAADLSPAGEQFKAGELTASKQGFIKNFKHAGLPLPIIHRAWFEQLTAQDMPPAIAFAFLDGDFFTSIQASLRVVAPLLSEGAVVVVDDYQSEALPGAKRAVDAWAHQHNITVIVEQSLAILRT